MSLRKEYPPELRSAVGHFIKKSSTLTYLLLKDKDNDTVSHLDDFLKNIILNLIEIKSKLYAPTIKSISKLGISYTNRWHLDSAIRDKPRQYFYTTDNSEKIQNKKLLIHFPEILSKEAQENFKIFTHILNEIFGVYICHNNNIVRFNNLYPTDFISTSELRDVMSDQNIDIENEYYILDYKTFLKSNENEDLFPVILNYPLRNAKTVEILHAISKVTYRFDHDQSVITGSSDMVFNGKHINFEFHEVGFGELLIDERFLNLKTATTYCQYIKKASIKSSQLVSMNIYTNHIDEMSISLLPNFKEIYFYDLEWIGNIILEDITQAEITDFYFYYSQKTDVINPQIGSQIAQLTARGFKIQVIDARNGYPRRVDLPILRNLASSDPMEQILSFHSEMMRSEGLQKQTIADSNVSFKNNCVFKFKGPIDASRYRTKMLVSIKYTSQGGLKFNPYIFNEATSRPAKYKEVSYSEFNQQSLKKRPKNIMGVAILSNLPEQWVPLKSHLLSNELIAIDKESISQLMKKNLMIEIRYSDTEQCFVRIKNKRPTTDATIVYLYYELAPKKSESKEVTAEPLPDDIRNIITHLSLMGTSQGKAIKGILESPENKKIEKIIEFCTAFEPKVITEIQKRVINDYLSKNGVTHSDLIEIASRLYYQAGVCDDRSKVAMILMLYFNIPARVISNETHAYIDYHDGNKWIRYNKLGGARVKIKNTHSWEKIQKDKKNLIIEEYKSEQTSSLVGNQDKLSVELEEKAEKEFESYFNHEPVVLEESNGFDHWYQSLVSFSQEHHPLILFKKNEDAWMLHARILQREGIKLAENYIYIHNLSTLEEYITQYSVNDEHECRKSEGPLVRLLKSQSINKVVLINITQLPVENIKSILDPHPIINGVKVSANNTIILIGHVEIDACSSFNSRVRYVAWPSQQTLDCDRHHPASEAKTELSHDSIDLYGLVDEWKNKLVGRKKLTSEGFEWKQGQLTSNSTSVELKAVPNLDSDFDDFIEYINIEKGCYANGVWRDLTPPIISEMTQECKMQRQIGRYDPNVENKNIYYINRQNYHELFERHTVTDDKKIQTISGLLVEIPAGSALVLTDEFSLGEIRKLEDALLELNIVLIDSINAIDQSFELTDKKYIYIKKLHLSKGKKNQYLNLENKLEQSVVILTNDIDRLAHKIEEKCIPDSITEVEVVNISTTMLFSDLFENAEPIRKKTHNEQASVKKYLEFNHEILPLFHFLEKKTHVLILKGTISSELYHQIETLFSPEPYLIINGIKRSIYGKVVLITQKHSTAPGLFDSALCRYSYEMDSLASSFSVQSRDVTLSAQPMTQEQKINDVLNHSCFVHLEGEPGTGKTHYVQHLLPQHCTYWGEAQIEAWLNSNKDSLSTDKQYLIIDEARMMPPGYWDFLKGLQRNKVLYKGYWYPVDSNILKVIFTDNSEKHAGRNHHSFLEQIPKVYFEPYDNDRLKKIINEKLLGFTQPLKDQLINGFIEAYREAERLLSPNQVFSVRDILSLLDHFNDSEVLEQDALPYAYCACIEVFYGLMKGQSKQLDFNNKLKKLFGCDASSLDGLLTPLPLLTDHSYILPESWRLLWHNVNRCIERSQKSLKTNRSSILIEGPSGTGKSELIFQALKWQGYIAYDSDADFTLEETHIYFHIAMGSESISQIIIQAAELSRTKNVFLVIDELNLLNHDQMMILNSILEGRKPDLENQDILIDDTTDRGKVKDSKQVSDEKTEYVPYRLNILASQNSQAEKKRKVLPKPLLNRFDRYYVLPFTRNDIVEIARKSCKFSLRPNDPRLNQFVSIFWTKQLNFPGLINPRKLFECLKKLPQYNDVVSEGLDYKVKIEEVESKQTLPQSSDTSVHTTQAFSAIPNVLVDEKSTVDDFLSQSNLVSKFSTVKDILLDAMKNPTDINGFGGNQSAKILFEKYNILVEKDYSGAEDSTNFHERNIKSVLSVIQKEERAILDKFNHLRKEKIKKDRRFYRKYSCGLFNGFSRSHIKKPKQSNVPQVETKPCLMHLIHASNPSYFTRFFGSLNVYGFYSGDRTHRIFKEMGIDTRDDVRSEITRDKIIKLE